MPKINTCFMKEIKGLVGNIYPDNLKYRKLGNFYRFYPAICFLLFLFFFNFKSYSQTTNTG